eukprot:Sspe_Gene.43043::Locus_20928_Transcript_1_1_Confidence_1.000_Length_1388::g.43043::m.43043
MVEWSGEIPFTEGTSAQIERTELAVLQCTFRKQRLRLMALCSKQLPKQAPRQRQQPLARVPDSCAEVEWDDLSASKKLHVRDFLSPRGLSREVLEATEEEDRATIMKLKEKLRAIHDNAQRREEEATERHVASSRVMKEHTRKIQRRERKNRHCLLRAFNAEYFPDSGDIPSPPSTPPTPVDTEPTPASPPSEDEDELKEMEQRVASCMERQEKLQQKMDAFGALVLSREEAVRTHRGLPREEELARRVLYRQWYSECEALHREWKESLSILENSADEALLPQLELKTQEKMGGLVERCNAFNRMYEDRESMEQLEKVLYLKLMK